jgi:hypothetical protein
VLDAGSRRAPALRAVAAQIIDTFSAAAALRRSSSTVARPRPPRKGYFKIGGVVGGKAMLMAERLRQVERDCGTHLLIHVYWQAVQVFEEGLR